MELSQTLNAGSLDPVVGRLERHIAQMASHQKERQGGKLLFDALAELKRLHKICGSKECVMCKRLVPHVQQFVSTDNTHPLCEGCWLEKEGKPSNDQALPQGGAKKALVQSWRVEADRTEEHAERDAWQLGAAQAIRICADALEAEIAANAEVSDRRPAASDSPETHNGSKARSIYDPI